jgi:phage shock protein A
LDAQREQLQSEQDKLVLAEQRLTAKLEAFRTQKETIKAQYTAAEAQVRIGEAVSGVSEEMADMGLSIERAQDRTATLQARAGALDELIGAGGLTDLTDGRDLLERELAQLSSAGQVEAELESVRRELRPGAAQPAGQLEGRGNRS